VAIGILRYLAGPIRAGNDHAHRLTIALITRTTSCASFQLGLEPLVALRIPNPRAEGSTPSGPASTRRASSAAECTLTTTEASSSVQCHLVRHMGRSRHGGHAGRNPAVLGHRRFDSFPAHACASRLPGRAPVSSTGTDWVRLPGRAPSCRNSVVRVPDCRSGGHGFESRRRRAMQSVDVVEWRRRRSTKPEAAGSTPAVDTTSP
jgi:hypothetical protein